MNVVVLAQARALADAGHAIRIFTRRADPSVAARVTLSPGLDVIHLDAGPARLLAKSEHERVMTEFSERLSAELADDPVDVLHAEHWFSGIAALPVARRWGIPLVQTFHSIAVPEGSGEPGERPESPGRLAGERRLAREADVLIAVSAAERGTILTDLGGAPDRVRVVELGVDAKLFRPRRSEERFDEAEALARGGRAEVIMVGRLHPLKAFGLALDALAVIPEARRPMLRIIGAPPPDGGAYARGLRDQAARLGVRDRVRFEGALSRAELAARIRGATLMLVPSHAETFGLVALEAAASGVPVVARAAGGLREAVHDGKTGVLVTGDDPQVWAAAVLSLLDDPVLLAALGQAAREHALGKSWGASAAGLLAEYRAVLERRSGVGAQATAAGLYRETSVVSNE